MYAYVFVFFEAPKGLRYELSFVKPTLFERKQEFFLWVPVKANSRCCRVLEVQPTSQSAMLLIQIIPNAFFSFIPF